MSDPTIVRIANEVGKSPAQVLIRWSLQRGFMPLPKSDRPERIASNADVYGFELSSEQVAAITATGASERLALAPDNTRVD